MGYLTAKQFSEKWGISERRIIKLCKEQRIDGAKKEGMVWEIPEEALKPSDKRSNISKYINIQKRIMIVNSKEEITEYLQSLLEKEGYIAEYKKLDEIGDLNKLEKYYEGLVYFSTNNMDKKEEAFIISFSSKLNSESSIVIIDYNNEKRNKVEKKVSSKLKNEIGLRINTLILDIQKNVDLIVNYTEIAEDILELLLKFKNSTGMTIITDGGKIKSKKSKLVLP